MEQKFEVVLGDGTRLAARTQVTEVRSMGHKAFDDDWAFTDAAGHDHYRAGNDFPTLTEVLEEPWWCDTCGDTHEDFTDHYECAQCGEVIVPGTKWVPEELLLIPGLTEYTREGTITVTSQEQAEDLLNRGYTLTQSTAGGTCTAKGAEYITKEQFQGLFDEFTATRNNPGNRKV